MASAAEAAEAAKTPPPPYLPRYIDIGINLADPIFQGIYHGKQHHESDLAAVVQRARAVGCAKLIVTGSDFKSSRDALQISRQFPGTVFTTIGIHPCSSSMFGSKPTSASGSDGTPPEDEPDPARTADTMAELRALLSEATIADAESAVVAFGEFGLDYDRLHYCSKKVQLHSFAAQLELAGSIEPRLPLFLHSRAAHPDFVALLKAQFGDRLERLEKGAVVHSFTGTLEEMTELAELGLYIGVNGCSLKTGENCAVVREIPLGSLMLETDGPWCEVRPSHEGWKYLRTPTPAAEENCAVSTAGGGGAEKRKAQKGLGKKGATVVESDVGDRYKVSAVKKEKWVAGAMVKGRNEPCSIETVAAIVAGIKGVGVEEVCEAAWNNTVKVFGVDR